ncbi:MAG: translation initiation factor IF-3 [Planctomycetes bacterium]|nr:translation initiation factor IF-3 [Planctomycetota bacterium]
MSFKRRPPPGGEAPSRGGSAEHRINRRIRVPRVQIIDHEGVNRGEMDTDAALRLAEENGLDLVEIVPNARPPVCKIMNYGQYKYNQKKKAKHSKGHQAKIKGVRLHPNTAEHDVNVWLKRSREFLERGDKVLIAVWFKGREIAHKERGQEILQRFVDALKELCKIEQNMRMEGKRMILLLAPLTQEEKNARKREAQAQAKGPTVNKPPEGAPAPQGSRPPAPALSAPAAPKPPGPAAAPQPAGTGPANT